MIKQHIENKIVRLSNLVTKRPALVLSLTVIFSLVVIIQIKNLWMDFSTEYFLPKGDTTVIDYQNFKSDFGASDVAFIGIEAKDTFYNLENLKKLKSLHEEIQSKVPFINEINSLVSVSHIEGTEEGLVVKDLVELWPETNEEIPEFKTTIEQNPNYIGKIISQDGKYALIAVKLEVYSAGDAEELLNFEDDFSHGFEGGFEDDKQHGNTNRNNDLELLSRQEETDFAKLIVDLAYKYHSDDFIIHPGGMPINNYNISRDMADSLGKNMVMGLCILMLLLWMLFQRISGVVLPIIIVSLTAAATIAWMPIFEVPFSGTTQILPSFLIAVGVADSVHILSIFYRHYDEHGQKGMAIRYAMKKTALAVIMTSVTTAAGLLSFMFADVIPTRMLGIYGALGVTLALIYSVVLIPALLMVLPIKQHKAKTEATLSTRMMEKIDTAILWLGRLGIKHSTAVVVISFFVTVIVIGGLFRLSMSNDAIRWYPEDNPVRVATESIDKNLNGSWTLEVVVDTETQGGLYQPQVLKFIENLISDAESMDGHIIKIKGTSSILDVVKQNHQALNENNPEYYEIPDNKELIAQELLLFENSGADDLQQYAVANFSKTRVTFFTPMVDAIYTRDFLDDFQIMLENTLRESGLSDIKAKMVGFILVSAKTTYNMAVSAIESYILAFALVGALMFVMMGGIRKGMLAFVPNIIPIVITLGMMGWIGIPLNFLTALIGCVIIGISVDDTIHFMHHFQDRISEGGSPEEAITNSLTMAGRAITFTSIALIGCFIIYAFDVMKLSRDFGIVLSISIFVALIANLVLAPALLVKFWKFKN